MKLTQLAPQFVAIIATDSRERWASVAELTDAQGILFTCPLCSNGHMVLVWFADRGVPPGHLPRPRWKVSGTGYSDLTLAPSINIAGCWHGFVTNGDVT